jgi:hypothetical protein
MSRMLGVDLDGARRIDGSHRLSAYTGAFFLWYDALPRLGTDRAALRPAMLMSCLRPRSHGRPRVLGWEELPEGRRPCGDARPGEPHHGGGRPAELAEHRGVITTTVVSGLIAVTVAAAEWTGSGRALDTPTGILWRMVALLGVVAMLLGIGLEVRRRRQVEPAVPASGPAGRPGPRLSRPHPAALPTGTVTFLFIDIEGSTRLLQELGDRYAAVRDRHAAIVRQAVEAGGGLEVSTEGDSFLCRVPKPGRGGSGRGRRPAWPCRLRVVPRPPAAGADGPAYRRGRPGR